MKRKKIEPSALTMVFQSPSVTGGQQEQFFIDLSQCASLLNRRFYRQGLNWAVASIKAVTSGDGVLYTQKMPNTWTMSNAWHKAFAAWQKMNRDAVAEAESVRPRFLDFKIYANERHHAKGFSTNLLPTNFYTDPAGAVVLNPATEGEWLASKFVVPDAPGGSVNNFEVIATGGSYPGAGASTLNAVSLIEGYASSRALPDVVDPNVPDDLADANGPTPENWLGALFNEGTSQVDQVLDDMRTENDQAPYPYENDGIHGDTMYPGGANQLRGLETHDVSFVTPTTIGGSTRIAGSNFPCGLMAFTWAPNGTSNIVFQVELVPGPHRGYLAMPMQEM